MICFAVFQCYAFSTLYAQAGKEKLNSLIEELRSNRDLRGATISLKAVDMSTGKEVYAYQSNINMIPASLQKLVTTGAGFIVLGSNYRFSTLLACSGTLVDSTLTGNIYIIGGGDPVLGSDSFRQTVPDSLFSRFRQALKRKGVNSFNGSIIPVAARLEAARIHPSWEWEDIGSYYGTGASGLNFHENSFTLRLKAEGMSPEKLSMTGDLPASCIIAQSIVPVHADSACDLTVYSSPLSMNYLVAGNLPSSGREYKVDAALSSPENECAERFVRFLAERGFPGGYFAGETMYDYPDEQFDTVYVETSPRYADLAKRCNKHSNNLYAESIFKSIAGMSETEPSFKTCAGIITALLKNRGLNTDGIRIVDGSGLSRRNFMTADFMCEYLRMIAVAVPDFETYLPAAGEGTLQTFMSGYKTRNRVRLKSGSMSGVLNYAGYVKNSHNRTVCLTIMLNNFTCKSGVARRKIEQIVDLIAEIN
ncbi:MAG: D-alanyl-D-alanine carboxypeptidase/D-alanyl-D-alanine-endopeptidase [Prevotellaceae bacterium]|jgi:D-alanyl-D-alanine carboxypeptidase/D-alanyl-D-alanine-endopeptidase (penicillin-binding protein 4)|nr:D-alanyl-D-alanine carboxypeptidase/D-alanyl-D-alanine-endopeptidase [Prevotellaceae bacterium]